MGLDPQLGSLRYFARARSKMLKLYQGTAVSGWVGLHWDRSAGHVCPYQIVKTFCTAVQNGRATRLLS